MVSQCIICRVEVFPSRISLKGESKLALATWKKECAKTLSQIIFDIKSHYLLHYLKKYEYCSKCLQTVRDLDFTWKQFQACKQKLSKYSSLIKRRIILNGGKSSKVIDESTVEANLDILSATLKDENHEAFLQKADQFSYDEVVQMISSKVASQKFDVFETANIEIGRNDNIKIEKLMSDGESGDEEEFDWSVDVKAEHVACDLDLSDNETTHLTYEEADEIITTGRVRRSRRPRKDYIDAIESIDGGESENDNSADEGNYTENQSEVDSDSNDAVPKPRKPKRMKRQAARPSPSLHPCPKCDKILKCARTLANHLRKQHESRPQFCCKFCGKGYFTEAELTEHYATSHQGPNPFSCAFCDNVCTNSIDLRKHVEDAHSDKLKCPTCGKRYALRTSLELHQRIHEDTSVLPRCPICEKPFVSESRLKRHVETHNTIKAYTCEVCGKGYRNAHGFQAHRGTHKAEKPFKCKICGKGFHGGSALKVHEVIHTGVKEYVCQVCGAPFASKYNMLAHEKIHQPGYKNTRKRNWKKKTATTDRAPSMGDQFHIMKYW